MVARFAAAGATELLLSVLGPRADRDRTLALLGELAAAVSTPG